MTKQAWISHIQEVAGVLPPSQGGEFEAWREAVRAHAQAEPHCPACKARSLTTRASYRRKMMEDVYKGMGLKKGKTALGRVIWE